ncbi:MAG: 4a-hydroxytetrahydrobiopterin dehydratase [Cyanobacteria bacterium J06623_7]
MTSSLAPKKLLKSSKFLPLIIAVNLGFCSLPAIANSMPLTQAEIEREMQTVPQWQQSKQTITRTFKFKNFVEAIAFVNKLVEPSEAAAHHPDLAISYNKVVVSLTSHDAGGLTTKDFSLAQTISDIAQ